MTEPLPAHSKSPRILIADDDPTVLKAVADRCERMGFEVETATNGIQALILARKNLPDVLIVDVNMPGADGLSVCARLLQPGRKSVEVIVITGSADPETIARCESYGMFYGRKGPDFWRILGSALATIFPHMANRILELETGSRGAEVRPRPHVLLVDDDPEVGAFLSSRLAKCGVDMLQAADGVQGYQIASRLRPNAVICDYFMTNGDAHYLLARLRSAPETGNTPFFVMSGSELDVLTTENLKRQICGYPGAAMILRKSLDVDELFGALERVCGFERNRWKSGLIDA
jgi:CheY-like chemotaxis protein